MLALDNNLRTKVGDTRIYHKGGQDAVVPYRALCLAQVGLRCVVRGESTHTRMPREKDGSECALCFCAKGSKGVWVASAARSCPAVGAHWICLHM